MSGYFLFKENNIYKYCEYCSLTREINIGTIFDKCFGFPYTVAIYLGSWSVQQERGGAVVVLRSLHWLGFTAYHLPGTPIFGYCYCGNGEKNLDLPFML